MKWFEDVVDGINAIHVNVWGILLIVVGSVLVSRGEATTGGNLITGGFALVTGAQIQKNQTPPTGGSGH